MVQSILSKTIDNDELTRFACQTSSDLHKTSKKHLINDTKTDVYKYKLIHTPSQIVYSSRPHKFQDGYKVFISTTDKYKVFIDECGNFNNIKILKSFPIPEIEYSGDPQEIYDYFKITEDEIEYVNMNFNFPKFNQSKWGSV